MVATGSRGGLRLLTIDIETSPAICFVWGLHKIYISPGQIIEPTRMLCFAAKWTDESKVIYRSEFHHKSKDMLQDLWSLLDEADAVIHYNGASFDVKHINREFVLAGMSPPSPYAQIDLYRTVRANFAFMSKKLDSVTAALDLGSKVKHEGFDLWKKCLEGDEKAWNSMKRYNIQDTKLTEQLYLELRPWIKGHPSSNLVSGVAQSCPTCGSKRLNKRGEQRTRIGAYQRYQCGDCGSYSRSGKSTETVDLRGL